MEIGRAQVDSGGSGRFEVINPTPIYFSFGDLGFRVEGA